jgi:hypothetical protein
MKKRSRNRERSKNRTVRDYLRRRETFFAFFFATFFFFAMVIVENELVLRADLDLEQCAFAFPLLRQQDKLDSL